MIIKPMENFINSKFTDIGLKIKDDLLSIKGLKSHNMTRFFILLIPLFVYSDIDDDQVLLKIWGY